ncbi:hypothetical protein FRB97_008175 [Tulasnella sp. 331]|nr:hypothetical protein FRB97_008175 [Tulasnella sp. 331]
MADNNKGKGKASNGCLDERTPLLNGGPSSRDERTALESPTRSPWNRRLLIGALALLALCSFATFIFIIAASYSFASCASHVEPEAMLAEGAIVWKGPSDIQVVHMAPEGILMQVEGRIGIDADWIIGLEHNSGTNARFGLFEGARKALGRWLVKRVDTITVTIGDIHLYAPYSRSQHRVPDAPLASIILQSITVPLTTRRSQFKMSDDSWLTPLSIPMLVYLNENSTLLMEFGKDSMQMGRVLARATVESMQLDVGDGKHWWQPPPIVKPGVDKIIKYDLPLLPPTTGDDDPIMSLIHLRSYSMITNPPEPPQIYAEADMENFMPVSSPLSNKELKLPLEMIITLLPADLPNPKPAGPNSDDTTLGAQIARVTETSLSLTHPNMSIEITGSVLPLSQTTAPYLSAFITRYLNAQSSPILITTAPPFSLSFRSTFPGPKERPKIVKTIHMRDMKLHPNGTNGFMASGTIEVGIALPDAVSDVELEVDKILPDILVFDGPPPPAFDKCDMTVGAPLVAFRNQPAMIRRADDDDDDEPEPFPAPPLPNPLPERAWARIRPTRWLNATSEPAPDPTSPGKNLTLVTSPFENLPLQLLPGRNAVFRKFVEKIVFKGSAIAGMRGLAAVRVNMDGLVLSDGGGHGMEIKGIPLEGAFEIRRGSVWNENLSQV